MTFAQERDMSAIVRGWMLGQRLHVKAEYVSPWGICDFVGLSFDPQKVRMRLRLRQRHPVGSLLRLAILQRIPDESQGAVSLQRLQREFDDFIAPDRVEAEVERLARSNFVRILVGGQLYKLNGWAPLHRRIVAIELKLSRVREALDQARSHLYFATEAFVAFPIELAQRIATDPRSERFHIAGVGILGVGDHKCKVLLRPRGREFSIDPVLQAHCVERFWRTVVTNTGA